MQRPSGFTGDVSNGFYLPVSAITMAAEQTMGVCRRISGGPAGSFLGVDLLWPVCVAFDVRTHNLAKYISLTSSQNMSLHSI